MPGPTGARGHGAVFFVWVALGLSSVVSQSVSVEAGQDLTLSRWKTIDVDEMTAELDETWLGESLDDIDGVSVDEEALAQAMTDDELGDMTPEELADLQTGDEDHDR